MGQKMGPCAPLSRIMVKRRISSDRAIQTDTVESKCSYEHSALSSEARKQTEYMRTAICEFVFKEIANECVTEDNEILGILEVEWSIQSRKV